MECTSQKYSYNFLEGNYMTNPILSKIGPRVGELRKSQGLSQQKLALKTGLHYTYIGAVERGERGFWLARGK